MRLQPSADLFHQGRIKRSQIHGPEQPFVPVRAHNRLLPAARDGEALAPTLASFAPALLSFSSRSLGSFSCDTAGFSSVCRVRSSSSASAKASNLGTARGNIFFAISIIASPACCGLIPANNALATDQAFAS